MNTYWFDIEVTGPVTEERTEALADRLATRGGIDATAQADHRGGTVMFSREADDAIQAIVSAIEDVEAVGMTATGVTEDRVTVDDIAERAGVTVTAVRYWISGGRGPGGFPQPKVARARGSLYSWAEVSAWLSRAKLGQGRPPRRRDRSRHLPRLRRPRGTPRHPRTATPRPAAHRRPGGVTGSNDDRFEPSLVLPANPTTSPTVAWASHPSAATSAAQRHLLHSNRELRLAQNEEAVADLRWVDWTA